MSKSLYFTSAEGCFNLHFASCSSQCGFGFSLFITYIFLEKFRFTLCGLQSVFSSCSRKSNVTLLGKSFQAGASVYAVLCVLHGVPPQELENILRGPHQVGQQEALGIHQGRCWCNTAPLQCSTGLKSKGMALRQEKTLQVLHSLLQRLHDQNKNSCL